MKSCIVLCVLSIAVMAFARPEEAQFTDVYNNVNRDEISKKLLPSPYEYIKCNHDQGKCKPDDKELKENITEVLENGCVKCTETQKKRSRRVIRHGINHEVDQYDPEREFTAKYEKELKDDLLEFLLVKQQ